MPHNLSVFTEGYWAECAGHCLDIRVKPDADFDDELVVYVCDTEEFMTINAWLWRFTHDYSIVGDAA